MNKFKSKYDYKSRSDNSVKPFMTDGGVRSTDDCDISQKIKSLEMEGLKLRNQVEEILNETSESLSTRTSDSTLGSSITACDDSGRHVNRYGATRSSDIGRIWAEPIYEDNVQINNEHQVDEYRHRLDQLQHKIKQDSFAHNLEKERLYGNIEDLKRVNFRLQSDIESQTKEFHEIERNHQMMSERLRCNLSQLLSVNKKQEETLIESGTRLEELCGAESAIRALDQLRDLLIDVDYYRGIRHTNEGDFECSSPTQLVDLVDKCFKEYNSDLDKRSRKIKELEDDIILIKRTLTHDKEKSLHDLRNQLAYEEEQNNYLKQHINEINENADRELERLREENVMIQAKLDEDMANATSLIDGLEQNLQELSNKNKKMNESWLTEKKSFEKVLDSNEKQIATIRAERDQAVNQKSSLAAKLDATQNQLTDTETSLLQLQSEKYASDKQIEMIRKQNKEMENSIMSSKKNFENILKTVRSCGDGDYNANNSYGDGDDSLIDNDDEADRGQIWKPKKYQIDETIHLIKSLNKKEKDVDLKHDKLRVEYEMLEKKLEAVDLQRRKLEQSFKAQQLDIDSSKNENAHINSLIANRNAEIERLTAERDYYFQLLNDKTDEVATIKTEKHRLAASLEERCRLLEIKGDTNQNSDLQRCNTSHSCSGKDQILRDDRNRLLNELKDTKKAYEELLTQHDDDSRNLGKCRQENWNLQTDLKNATKEYDDLIAENRKLAMKLKDAESEIANLCRELQNHNGIKSRKHTSLEKKMAELVSEITSNKNELKIAHERIKYLEKGISKSSSKAPQATILNNLHGVTHDADNLKAANNRLSNLEQQMLTLDGNQSNLRDENLKLTDLLKKVTCQNERMSEELETYVEENKRLRKEVSFFDTQKPYCRTKSERIPKKFREQVNYSSDKRTRHHDSQSENLSNDISHDESLKQLRQDLQGSIKDAKRLLSSTPLLDSNDDNAVPSKHSDYHNFSQRSSKNQDSSGSNNNNLEKLSSSEPADSSTVNTRRSDSTSLTEADRYIFLPLNKTKDSDYNSPDDERPTSAIQELLSPNTNQSIHINKSKRDSYMLEEKIKRLLATEG